MIKSNDFARDWYGFTTNQISHLAFGVLFAWLLAYVYFKVAGEYPVKMEMVLVLAVGYFLFEILTQGWQGLDTVEDWIFFTIYGVGGATASFHERMLGDSVLGMNPEAPIPFAICASAHLLFGIVSRVMAARRASER